MTDKKFTPKEAAVMVLAKAQELYKATSLAKGDWAKIHSKLKREGYSEESADKIDGAIKAKMGKSEDPMQKMGMSEQNPDAKADADLGEKVEQDVQQHEATNQDPKHEMKGHIKLAKFMGRMDFKRGQKAKEMDKAETGHEKGVHPSSNDLASKQQGMSDAGINTRADAMRTPGDSTGYAKNRAVAQHKQVLGEMKAQPKPKLPG